MTDQTQGSAAQGSTAADDGKSAQSGAAGADAAAIAAAAALANAGTNADASKTGADGKPTDDAAAKAAADAAAKAASVPDAYELKMPEGVELDSALLEQVSPVFKELGLTNDQAQKLADKFSAHLTAQAKANEDAHGQQIEDWGKQAQADKEIGGIAFDQNAQIAQKAIARFATPELKALLDTTGYGNHPEMVRMFLRIGKGISEDGVVRSNDSGGGRKSDADVFYPSQT